MVDEHDLSTVVGWEGNREEFADVSEFTNYLAADHPLSSEVLTGEKWVFWSPETYQKSPIIQNKIKILVSKPLPKTYILVQFWAPKIVGNRRYLTLSDQPFAVGGLHKGTCWYRKLCMNHGNIIVDEGANEEQLGAVGRVYLKGYPESSPDLMLYSTQELPLRDDAARCGARGYLVVPVFDLLTNECYGVLELLLFFRAPMVLVFDLVEIALQAAELRSTHFKKTQPPGYNDEIEKTLHLAREIVPQLHMAQVWIPCKQCANTTTDFCCMELLDSINFVDIMWPDIPNACTYDYTHASRFHRLQKGIIAKAVMSSNIKSCFCQNICDFSQSENPLAHYAQKSRLSFCFAICLESVQNSEDLYFLEFFLQSNGRQDPRTASLCTLMGLMDVILKSFKVPSPTEQVIEVRKDMLSNSIEFVHDNEHGVLEDALWGEDESSKASDLLNYHGTYPSEQEFKKYLKTDDHFSCFKSRKIGMSTWLFWCPSFQRNSNQEEIKRLLGNLITKWSITSFGLLQFWACKMDDEEWCYLATSDQTFAVSGLHKGLALFRKRCLKHRYFVDEGAKEEELGPIGRVFRSGHPEITHDLRLYSSKEFPLKNDAAFCNLRSYMAFPIFDHQYKCLGVLEIVGIDVNTEDTLKCVQKAVKSTRLTSTHINYKPTFGGMFVLSLTEIKEALRIVEKIPQLRSAEVWVPTNDCSKTSNSLQCMQRVACSYSEGEVLFDVIETGKGIVGMVLASKNKCCYCKNSCRFSITEQSRPHHAQQKRSDVLFAICLQSSHTGYLPFVLNFFLNQGPGGYDYLWSFLYFLLPILKQQLKSFKVATGKHLGDELVVDIIEFCHEVNQTTSLQFGQPNMFPVKCQIVQYDQQEHQQSTALQMNEMDRATSAVEEGNQCSTREAILEEEEEDTSRRIVKGKMRTGLHITLEDLKRQFGKNREDAAKNLSVSISTFKRACRFHNIHRWPSGKKHRKNPSLYMTRNANTHDGDPQQSTGPSSSSLGLPLHENVPPANTESNQDLSIVPETDLVIIKAKYADEIVKFQLCPSLGMDKLAEEVGTRLNLEMGSFKLKYVDEDNDHISLTRDADFQLYVKSLKATGKNCLPMFVELIRAK